MPDPSHSSCNFRGIEVKFPYHPYSSQRYYMDSVIRAIKEGENALLESPTGTGKTLSLLCSTLACIMENKTKRGGLQIKQEENRPESMENDLLAKANNMRASLDVETKKIKSTNEGKLNIIYTSRTHSQLKQVIAEVKKTEYYKEFTKNTLRHAVLASRDQLCVNPTRGNLTGEHLNTYCRTLVQNRKCRYYNNIKNLKNTDEHSTNELLDIEDMIADGKNRCYCPYFKVKDSQDAADFLLLPYNYLLTTNIREAMDLKIKNSIVIIDEAHNVESVAEGASSFTIKQTEIAKYLSALGRFFEFHAACKQDQMAAEELKVNVYTLRTLMRCLKATDEFLTEVELFNPKMAVKRINDDVGEKWVVPEIQRNHVVFSGTSMFAYMFGKLQYRELEGTRTEETLAQTITVLTRGEIESEPLAIYFPNFYDDKIVKDDLVALSGLKKFVGMILSQDIRDFSQYYNVIVSNDEKYDGTKRPKSSRGSESRKSGWNKKFKKGTFELEVEDSQEFRFDVTPKVMSFVCMQSIPTFVKLMNEGVRSILLTSGTLGPLDVLEQHLGGGKVKFGIKVQSQHVIDPERVWAGVVTEDSSNNMLSSAYNSRRNTSYITGLGDTLLSFLKCVPEGVLVFFASYEVMNYTIQEWKRMGMYAKLEMVKSLFVEARQNAANKEGDLVSPSTLQLFKAYKNNIDMGKASAFFCICRGRMAEGIDFSDSYCRGIFVCGIPYPNRYEDLAALKMDYLNHLTVKDGHKNNLANQWYTSEAVRAINQAVGRSIRHIGDYGGIVLADYRFKSAPIKPSISRWVLDRLKIFTKIEDCTGELMAFFNKFSKEKPKVEEKKKPKNFVQIEQDPTLDFKPRETIVTSKKSTSYDSKLKSIKIEKGNKSILSYMQRIDKTPVTNAQTTQSNDPTLNKLGTWNFNQSPKQEPENNP